MKVLHQTQFKYDKETKTFLVDGKQVQFDTSFKLINTKTKGEMDFNFSESTGSEWDPKTLWIYKSKCGKYKMHLTNEDVTPQHAENYLKAKLHNASPDSH